MPILRLYFLGPLVTRYDERQLPVPPTLKSQSLLAYLVLHRDQPQPRDRLATLFWGDRPERKARRSLSTALWHVRRCLPDDRFILSDPYTVQFDPRAALWLDVDEFRSLVSLDDVASLQSAVALYRGDFLDGFYDDWIVNERYRLEALYLEALARLTAGHEGEGNHERALAAALRLLDHDPLREDAHRAAMRAYCRLGLRAGGRKASQAARKTPQWGTHKGRCSILTTAMAPIALCPTCSTSPRTTRSRFLTLIGMGSSMFTGPGEGVQIPSGITSCALWAARCSCLWSAAPIQRATD
jgi:DNA-binding SARP family transcriptional activator